MLLSREEANARLLCRGGEFELLEEEVRGVRMKVWCDTPRSLYEVLWRSRRHGSLTYIVYENERLTFEEHYAAASHLARALVNHGIEKGDRVAIAMRNFPEWSIAFWATTAIGAIAVPLNAWWTGRELHYGLEDSGSRVLIADGERVERLQSHLEGLSLEHRVAVRLSGTQELPEGWTAWESWVPKDLSGEPPEFPTVELEPDDDATIFYTSGTTGSPKGALGTHRNICANLRTAEFLRVQAELRTGRKPPPGMQMASLLSVPLFHVTGCHATMVPCLSGGHKLILVYRFDPDETLELIERERATSFGGVPTLVWKSLECESFANRDLSSVLRVGYGGAPAAPELVRRLQQDIPHATLTNGYGLTESSSVAARNSGEDYINKPDSVGLPIPVCDMKIMDEEGHVLPVGEVGELWIKGPIIIKGYWNRPEETAETFTDGWLHSGDMARFDEEGFVYIVDRGKDMVIRGGENIYCVEVESALFEHPDVIDAAAFGVPHRVLGEELAAFVQVRRDAETTAEDVFGFLKDRVAAFKIPAYLVITREHFPRNANGKTMKRELREQMLASFKQGVAGTG